MDKMSIKDATDVRVNLYGVTIDALQNEGFVVEPIKGGSLIHLGNGYFAKMAISVCDASKFDLEATRAEYAEAVATRKVKTEEAKAKAEAKEAAKAEREAAKAEKEAAKAAKEATK